MRWGWGLVVGLLGVALGALGPAVGPAAGDATARPALPAEIPSAERQKLQRVAETAAVSTHIEAEPFLGRGDVFEYLLDHPEFATHVTRTLRLARYRIWRNGDGLMLDDGWGAVGHFAVVYAAGRTRVIYARGQFEQRLLPSIKGQAVVVIDYGVQPAPAGRTLISTAIRGFVKLDSPILSFAGKLAGALATAKADKEAGRLVKVFARVSRAVDDNPTAVYEQLRQRPDVPQKELEEFRQLIHAR